MEAVRKDEDGNTLIDLPEETVLTMVALGFAHVADDGIHEFTEAGKQWIEAFCESVLEKGE